MQKHKANVVREVPENVELQRLVDKYGIQLKKNMSRGGKDKANVLTGFARALDIIRHQGSGMMDDIFKILCGARWNLIPKGLGNVSLSTVKNVLALHPDYREAIINTTTEWFRQIDLSTLVTLGVKEYPNRKPIEQTTLVLEDYLHNQLGMPILFLASDKSIERHIAA